MTPSKLFSSVWPAMLFLWLLSLFSRGREHSGYSGPVPDWLEMLGLKTSEP